MPLQCEPVDLKELIRGIEETMRPLFEEGGITFDIVLPPRLPHAFVDASLLHRVLQNLLSNAVRHTPQHGTITLSADTTADRLLLRVADTGSGIDPSLHDHLFEKFVSGDKGSGIGLGLAFCRLAAEAMNGEIWLDETVTEGTTFVLSLPTHSCEKHPPLLQSNRMQPSRLTD
jgi:signal transduction histidine kinase